MGEIKKIGDVYYIEFYARGLLYSKVGGPDLASAQKLLKETEAAIAGGEALTVVREIEVAVFFERFLSYAHAEFGAVSAERFQSVIGHFTEFLSTHYKPIQHLSKLTPSIFEAYKAAIMPLAKPNLVNFRILLLREVMEFGIKLGFINDNPTLHVRLLALPVKKCPLTKRYGTARELLSQGVPLGKVCKLLRLTDIARVSYFANLIPLNRQDMYN